MAGPEKAAMLLIPSYLPTCGPSADLDVLHWCTGVTFFARVAVQPRDELEVAVSTVELSEMIPSLCPEGLADPEAHNRPHPRCKAQTTVADVAVPGRQSTPVPSAAPALGPLSSSRRLWPHRLFAIPGGRSRPRIRWLSHLKTCFRCVGSRTP